MVTAAEVLPDAHRAGRTGLSVVIPTRDRIDTLMCTLDALEAQSGLAVDLQIVVVDDGSHDGTAEIVRARPTGRYALEVVRQDPAGPATARNRGIRLCQGERVLLLGDDTIPAPTCLAAHLDAASGRDVAVQGVVDWDPSVGITPLMEFMAPAGPQFYFEGLANGDPITWSRMAGSNLSAPRAWFESEPFDEDFPSACFEDTEMAYRWSRRGWGGLFSRHARCLHRHRYEQPAVLWRRQRAAGWAARMVIRRHPALAWTLAGQVGLAGAVVGVRALGRWFMGRGRIQDRWDLRWRLAYLSGLLIGAGHST